MHAVKKKKISEADIKSVMTEIVKGKSFEEAIKIEKAEIENVEEKIHQIRGYL